MTRRRINGSIGSHRRNMGADTHVQGHWDDLRGMGFGRLGVFHMSCIGAVLVPDAWVLAKQHFATAL